MSDFYARELEREREFEMRQAERAFREDLYRNYEYDGYGTWYPKDGFGCGRYQDADGNWHSEM